MSKVFINPRIYSSEDEDCSIGMSKVHILDKHQRAKCGVEMDDMFGRIIGKWVGSERTMPGGEIINIRLDQRGLPPFPYKEIEADRLCGNCFKGK